MKKTLTLILLLVGLAHACQSKGPQFISVATEAEGGIAAARPALEVLVVRKADGSAVVMTRTRDGVVKRGALKSFDTFAATLNPVFALPEEQEHGMSDAYGFKRSFHVHLKDRCWEHYPPGGCVRSQPKVKPTAAEKASFDKLTGLVTGLTSVATSASSEDAWNAAHKSLDG